MNASLLNSENPFAAPASEQPVAQEFVEFLTSFFPSWCIISLSAVINVPLVVLSTPVLPPLSLGAVTLVGTLLLSAAANWVIIRQFTVQVSATRLRCCDVWGKYLDVEWERIERAKPTKAFFGISYIRVFSSQLKRPIWLPLFLTERSEFFECVLKFSKPDSPLVQALQTAGFSRRVDKV